MQRAGVFTNSDRADENRDEYENDCDRGIYRPILQTTPPRSGFWQVKCLVPSSTMRSRPAFSAYTSSKKTADIFAACFARLQMNIDDFFYLLVQSFVGQ